MRVSVPVARWLGERLAAPHSAKYWLGPRDRKMKPAPAPGGQQYVKQKKTASPALYWCFGVFVKTSASPSPVDCELARRCKIADEAHAEDCCCCPCMHACACAAPASAGPWYDVYGSDDEGVPEEEHFWYKRPGANFCYLQHQIACLLRSCDKEL